MDKKMRMSPMRRATLHKLAVSGAIGAGGFAGLMRTALAVDPRQGIRQMKGNVTIDGKPAEHGQTIRPGQKVATGTDGEVVFVIGKDAFLQRANSEFIIERGTGVAVLRYITGKVLSVFGKGRKMLETPTATIGIRGTGCYIEAEQARTYFCLCYGVADIVPNSDPQQHETLHTKHHDYPVYIDNGPMPTMMVKAKVINHIDDELIMLEALVGRKPPFYGKNDKDDY
jgi:hypothetical protein